MGVYNYTDIIEDKIRLVMNQQSKSGTSNPVAPAIQYCFKDGKLLAWLLNTVQPVDKSQDPSPFSLRLAEFSAHDV